MSKSTIQFYTQMLIWKEYCKLFNLTVENLPNFAYKGIPEDIVEAIRSAEKKEIILDDKALRFKATKSQIKDMAKMVFNKIFFCDTKNEVLFNKLWSKVVLNSKIECPVEGMTCGKTNLEMNLKGKQKIGVRNIEFNRLDTYYAVVSFMHESAHALRLILGKKNCMHKHVYLTEYFPIVCEKLAAIIVAEELNDQRFYSICDNLRTNEIIKYEKFLRETYQERDILLKKLEADKGFGDVSMMELNFKQEIMTYQIVTWLGYIISEFYALETVRVFQEDSAQVGQFFAKLKHDKNVEEIIAALNLDITSDSSRGRIIEKFKK